MQGDPGKSGEKVRKCILPHVKNVDERRTNYCSQVCTGKEFTLEEGMYQWFCQGKGTKLVEMFPTNFTNSGYHLNLQLI